MNKKISKIINFTSTTCAPCIEFNPIFKNVSKQFDNIQFETINIEDESSERFMEEYQIKRVPSVIILDGNNNLIYKILGKISENDFIEIINDILNNEKS